ncbi:hypothetical protein HPP92_018030 [Vanilla planifolia]|uniref:AUGMIN subunit 7 n=1 Tax=Vanilla planifolia TaxID=51239 RepID=A0A835UMY9_VANPL|nr:hypothetical protein HPP92_018030 [Vanilla planifolia]
MTRKGKEEEVLTMSMRNRDVKEMEVLAAKVKKKGFCGGFISFTSSHLRRQKRRRGLCSQFHVKIWLRYLTSWELPLQLILKPFRYRHNPWIQASTNKANYRTSVSGRGSYEERADFLHLVVDLVEASCYADNPDWSVDEQLAKDTQLLDLIAEKQAQIFSEEFKLFPADVQIQSVSPLPDISELETKLSEHSNQLSNLQRIAQELASKYEYNPNEEYAETELKLRTQLESFLETVRTFNLIYSKEIRPWTNMMEVPQLHGFGPAANRLLEAYNTLLKFLGNMRSLRDAHAALAGGPDSMSNEPSSVTKLILDCESALTYLNRNLAVLSASVTREQGGSFSLQH